MPSTVIAERIGWPYSISYVERSGGGAAAGVSGCCSPPPANGSTGSPKPTPAAGSKRYPLLVIDEVGYIPLEPEAANLFLQLVSGRYERASLIVTGTCHSAAGAKSSATSSTLP